MGLGVGEVHTYLEGVLDCGRRGGGGAEEQVACEFGWECHSE
jgi:hypothetical protein